MDRTRRSFFVDLLSGAAGGWVALTGSGALATFLAACTRKKAPSGGAKPEPAEKYGGPPERPEPRDLVDKYGGPRGAPEPAVVKYGGPETKPPPDAGAPATRATPPLPTGKYGGAPSGPGLKDLADKYGGPMRGPEPVLVKYGGPRPPRPAAKKYGGPVTRKYGGPKDTTDL